MNRVKITPTQPDLHIGTAPTKMLTHSLRGNSRQLVLILIELIWSLFSHSSKTGNYVLGPEFVTQFIDTIHSVPQENLSHILGLSESVHNRKVR